MPPLSHAFPPGADDVERGRSKELLDWVRDRGPDEEGALRVTYRTARVGIIASSKIPFLCGEVTGGGGAWHRFAVYSIGAAATPPSPTFYWTKTHSALQDFCNSPQEDLQWYAVPDSVMNGS